MIDYTKQIVMKAGKWPLLLAFLSTTGA